MEDKGVIEDIEGSSRAGPSGAFVFFGATGDLAYKKIFPALQNMIRGGRLNVPIVGVAKSGWGLDELRDRARKSIKDHDGVVDEAAFSKLCHLLRYVDGDYGDPGTYVKLGDTLGGAARPAHYLAIPPSLFETVVKGIERAGCAKDARVILESPLDGTSLQRAR